MAAVNKIVITSIDVEKAAAAGKFNIEIAWDVDDGALSYKGSFWLIPYYEGGNDTLIEIPYLPQQKRWRKLMDVSLDKEKVYSLALTAVNTGTYTTCDKVPITTETFEGVGIHYENDAAVIGWNPPHASICGGLMRLEFSGTDEYYDYVVESGPRVYTFTIPEAGFDSNRYHMLLPSPWFTQAACSVSIFPYASEISTGPVSEKITLDLRPLTIMSVSLGAIDKHARSVTVELSAAVPPTHVQLGFYAGEKLIYMTDPVAFAASVTVPLQGQFAYHAEQYEIAAYTSNNTSRTFNRRKTAANVISLAPPKVSADISIPGQVTLNWTHEAPDCTAYLVGGETVYGNSCTLSNANLDEAITLTPKYGDKSGAAAVIKPFQEGFYSTGGVISYRGEGFGTRGFCVVLPNSGVTEDVIKSDFKFEKASNKVTVSADNPSRDDYLEWMKQLFDKGLTVEAYYKIRDIFSRLLTTTEADRIWYMAGIDMSALKRADILPGMTMRVESAQYMPQTRSTADYLAGYVPSSVADYTIGLDGGYLTASPYLNKTLGHFPYMSEPYANPMFHASAGGLDFNNIDMKQPFWALSYPEEFPRSESESNLYTTANTVLFALPKFIDTLTLDSEIQYHMVFRARCTVSLFCTIFVNSAPRLIPVGTTVGDLLSSLGRAAQRPKLYRNTGLGNMAEMFWFAESAYLMQGDSLEVSPW